MFLTYLFYKDFFFKSKSKILIFLCLVAFTLTGVGFKYVIGFFIFCKGKTYSISIKVSEKSCFIGQSSNFPTSAQLSNFKLFNLKLFNFSFFPTALSMNRKTESEQHILLTFNFFQWFSPLEQALKYITAKISSTSGDARTALEICRQAIENNIIRYNQRKAPSSIYVRVEDAIKERFLIMT